MMGHQGRAIGTRPWNCNGMRRVLASGHAANEQRNGARLEAGGRGSEGGLRGTEAEGFRWGKVAEWSGKGRIPLSKRI